MQFLKKWLKEYKRFTSKEKLSRLRYLRKFVKNPTRSINFYNGDFTYYFDFENCCLRELNGNIIMGFQLDDSITTEVKDGLLKSVDLDIYSSDEFKYIFNEDFNEFDYNYLNMKDILSIEVLRKDELKFITEYGR